MRKIEYPRLADRTVPPQLKSEMFRLVDQFNMVLAELEVKLKEMEDKLNEKYVQR